MSETRGVLQARRRRDGRWGAPLSFSFAHAGEFESARLAFSQALSIRRDSDTLWNLAIVEKNTHHEVDACRHIREYLRRPDHQASDDPAAHKLLDAMYPAIGHLRVTAPSDATLAVDGQTLTERAPLADIYDVTPGDHVVRAASGTAANEVHVTAASGVETPAAIVFAATPVGPITEPPKTETRTALLHRSRAPAARRARPGSSPTPRQTSEARHASRAVVSSTPTAC